MKIKRTKIMSVLIYVSYSVWGLSILALLPWDESQGVFGAYVLSHMAIAIILLHKHTGAWLSVASIFTAFLYLFHEGQMVLRFLAPSYKYSNYDLEQVFGASIFKESSLMSMVVITVMVLGIMMNCGMDKLAIRNGKGIFGKIVHWTETLEERPKNYIFAGWFIVVTTFPVHFMVAYGQLIAARQGDYFDVFAVNTSGIVYTYSQFLLLGITLLMLGHRAKKNRLFLTYIFTVGYFVWTMLSGGRGRAVIAIVYFSLLYLRLTKVSIIKIISIGAIGYMGLVFLTVIAENRNFGAITGNVILSSLNNIQSPLWKILGEFGGTQSTVIIAMNKIPLLRPFKCGLTYLLSLVSVLPDVGGIFTELNKNASFLHDISEPYIGGSIIAELYANFGWFSFPFALIIGKFIGVVSCYFDHAFRMKKYWIVPFLTLICTGLFWWIRDMFNSIIRNPIWAAFYLFFLLSLVVKSKSKNIGTGLTERYP